MDDCASGSWGEQFACLIASPRTSVDLVVTMISAGIAALVAILVLRRQFRHDRALADRQARASELLAHAAMLRPYVDQLGNAFIDVANARERLGGGAGHLGKIGAEVVRQRRNPDFMVVEQVWSRLEGHLTAVDSMQVRALSLDIALRWAQAGRFARDVIGVPPVDGYSPDHPVAMSIGLAATHLLVNPEKRASNAGAMLLAWDCIGSIDLREAFEGWERPVNLSDLREFDERMEREFYQVMSAGLAGELPERILQALHEKVGPPPTDGSWTRGPMFG